MAINSVLLLHVCGVDAFMIPLTAMPSRVSFQTSIQSSIESVEPATATTNSATTTLSSEGVTPSREARLAEQKRKLLGLIQPRTYIDPVLADPVTKQPLQVTVQRRGRDVKVRMLSTAARATTTPSECYEGSIDTYLDLLNPIQISDESTTDGERLVTSTNNQLTWLMRQATPYLPPPVRSALASTASGDEYIPMRDLFTSPAVSFAYERGWRQGFAQAGFPGPDIEAKMASEYFAPAIASVPANKTSVLVDMSCATGLFTRRFASMDIADRVIGCDYSDSMLTEARRRIQTDPGLSRSRGLDLVRLDVGQIPMQDNSVDALHAGAAMHCWPDLDAAASEIYRVLKPGGRYFASTFLSRYFATLSGMDGQANTPPSQQAFQYFDSIDSLSSLLERGGFSREKILIEVIGNGTLAHHHK